MTPTQFNELLVKLDACKEAIDFCKDKTLQQAWDTCHRSDWMFWLMINANTSATDKQLRLIAVKCAREVQHLMTDQRSINALHVAERYANGEATDDELAAARAAALDAAGDAAWDAAGDAAWDAAWAAARDAAGDAAWDAAGDAAWDAAGDAAWDAARAAAWDAAWDAARDAAGAAAGAAAWDAAGAAARAKQADIIRELIPTIEIL